MSKECYCGRSYIRDNDKQCSTCDADDERNVKESRLDVMMLNNVETLDELKDWIKEYLIK